MTSLSHGSACMPRMVPRLSFEATLACTGPKSGSPSAVIFSRCQVSANQPRVVAADVEAHDEQPGMGVCSTVI